jgi:twinfilin-like protein
VLFRKGEVNDQSWVLLSYVPDYATVRDKMLYASTKSSLTKELGESRFVDAMYGTVADEFTLEGYKKHLVHKNAAAPLTSKEAELNEIKLSEIGVDIGTESRRSHVSGVSFPIGDSAKGVDYLQELNSTQTACAFVFSINADEKIDLVNRHKISGSEESSYDDLVNDLAVNLLPKDQPCFAAFNFKASGNDKIHIVFLYSCPQAASIRQKMLFSSCRSNLLKWLQDDYKIDFSKKFELSDLTELTAPFIKTELGLTSVGVQPKNHGFIKKTVSRPGRK